MINLTHGIVSAATVSNIVKASIELVTNAADSNTQLKITSVGSTVVDIYRDNIFLFTVNIPNGSTTMSTNHGTGGFIMRYDSPGIITGYELVTDSVDSAEILSSPDLTSLQNFANSKSKITAFGLVDAPLLNNLNSAFRSASNILSIQLPDTSNLTDATSFVEITPSLICISRINTLTAITTNMFNLATALTNPTPAEQTAILAGSNYVNLNPCP